ncbi:hypothetical protein D3C79_926290 [compost metagenome]
MCLQEAPGGPELLELLPALGVQGVHLAGRTLLARDLLDVDEVLLLDAHQECVDRAFGDVGESVVADACGDLVPVCRLLGEESQNDALQSALEHLGHLLAHEALLPLCLFRCSVLSVAGYRYKVTLSTGT